MSNRPRPPQRSFGGIRVKKGLKDKTTEVNRVIVGFVDIFQTTCAEAKSK